MPIYPRMNAIVPTGVSLLRRIAWACLLIFVALAPAAQAASYDIAEASGVSGLLDVISDPNVAFILLLVGVYGILIEFFTPGIFAPGVIGVISLILALIALSTLPVQLGALGLLLLGIGMMAGEAYVPSGALAIGGIAAFIFGAMFLFSNGAAPAPHVSLPLIFGAVIAGAALSLIIVGAALKARKRPPAAGPEQIIGSRAQVVEWNADRGTVHILGEHWAATGPAALKSGDHVRVIARDGLTLTVEPE